MSVNKNTKLQFLMILLVSIFLLAPIFLVQSYGTYVVINEVAWAGTTEDWRYEWIELYNGSGSAVDVIGWQIENAQAKNGTLILGSDGPAQSALRIEADKYFLVCRKEMNGCDVVETKLSLHNEYDQNGKLILKNSSGGTIDATSPVESAWPGGDNETKQTMERVESDWQTSQKPNGTPKSTNSIVKAPEADPEPLIAPEPLPPEPPAEEPTHPTEQPDERSLAPFIVEESSEPEPEPKPEPKPVLTPDESGRSEAPSRVEYPQNIFINEILPSPEGADAENEWIELYNSNSFEVDLTGWQVQDTVGAVRTYTFPTDITINSLDFLVLTRPETKITLQNSGDGLELLNPNQELVYFVDYPKSPQGQSYNKIGESWEWSAVLTPKAQNIIPQPKKLSESRTLTVEKNASPDDAETRPKMARITENEEKTAANIEKALPKTSRRILTFIFAIIIAVGSGVVALLIKTKNI